MEKHRDLEGEVKRRWTPTREEALDIRASPNSLEIHLQWTPTGCWPKDIQYKKIEKKLIHYYYNKSFTDIQN